MSSGSESVLPAAALTWAQTAAPDAIVRVAPLGGGITNTKWALELADGQQLVMRWADPAVWGTTGREHVRRETLACEVLLGSGLPVPVVIASDLTGDAAGGPADLLTWLPGRRRLDPLGQDAVEALAGIAVGIHRQPVSAGHRPPSFGLRGPSDPQVPDWTGRPELWRRALEISRDPVPSHRWGLVHGDFHLGNLVWEGDGVSGVVDWAETSWGPADLDVAHLCSDFAMMHSVEDADQFRRAYLRAGGQLDPAAMAYWTVRDVLGFLPDPAHILPAVHSARPDLTAAAIREALEQLLVDTIDG